ncbi:MAG: alpha/beta hydrolase [Rhodospirillales bacterium]
MTRIYFATNRDRSRKKNEYFGERFHDDGPQFYRVGSAEVEKVSDDPDSGYKVRSVELFPERQPNPETGRGGLAGSSALFNELREQVKTDMRDVLVFIHGFASTFVSSLERAAQLKDTYLIDPGDGAEPYAPHTVALSWPSNGRTVPPWEYHSDRDDAAMSGTAMARFFMRFWDFLNQQGACDRRVHVVAHSMGNWALRHAILGIRDLLAGKQSAGSGGGRLPKVFDTAFLMAADEDDDALEKDHKLGLLTQLAREIHVYHNSEDRALTISDVTKFNPDRLGSDGPRTFSGLTGRVTAIDCSRVAFTDLFHARHQYYRVRPEVVADVRNVLSDRFKPDEVPDRVTVEPGRRFRIKKA